jgi:hypothetical protein
MIDFVVTYVDADDKKWQKEFLKYNSNGVEECRYRNWNNFYYCIECMLKNAPWVNKIFLIVSDESQIPLYKNINNNKIKIVYHRDYIPDEFLPTFNSNTIELFLHKIPELSEKFVLFNDDFFIIDVIPQELFFINNLPVDMTEIEYYRPFASDCFSQTLNNNYNLVHKTQNKIFFTDPHFPIPHLKSIYFQVWNLYEKELLMSITMLRKPINYTHWLFRYWYLSIRKSYYVDLSRYEKTIVLSDKITVEFLLKMFNSYKILVLNDTELLSTEHFEKLRNAILKIFKSKFNE